jgi:NAD(P)-dependent dehydrogenase (short-subunit alcohol dehydrogenase family)
MKRVLVVGATGDVGQGAVAALLDAGLAVVAAGRSQERLARLGEAHAGRPLHLVAADLSDEVGAEALWEESSAEGSIDAVVVAVNAKNEARPLLDWTVDELAGVLRSNLLTHFTAARTFIPRLPRDGAFIGIGGGTADFVITKMGQLSMCQAAQRMMYRALAKEAKDGPAVRELMVISMVNGESKRAIAQPDWLTDHDIGRHLAAILADPAGFPGPILELRSRDQVGQPASV